MVGALTPSFAQNVSLPPGEKPREIRGMELENKLGDKLPLSLKLQDSNGKSITLGEKFGKGRPVVLVMVYFRCPLLCPQMQQMVIASFNQIPDFTVGTEYDVVFVSFDPRDTAADAAKAKDFALVSYDRLTNEPVRQGFSYLVGEASQTRALADSLGYPYRFLKESGEFSHGTAVYIVSPEGTISACFPKLDYNPKDFRLALVEASNGKIGTLLDTFTLWCYHSTVTGEYQLVAMKVMRLGGAATVVILGAFVGFWVYRDRRRRQKSEIAGANLSGGGVSGAGEGGRGVMGRGTDRNAALPSALGHLR